MSDKALVLKALQRLPENATMVDIRKGIEFIAAVQEGREQVRCGDTVSLHEVEKKIQAWRLS